MRKDNLIMPAIILCLICLVTTGLLSLTFSVTESARIKQEEITANTNRQKLYPAAASFEAVEVPSDSPDYTGLQEAYIAKDSTGTALGLLFVSQYQGYSSAVPVMLAVDPKGQISDLLILQNDETPGLGKKVESKSFYRQFIGKDVTKAFSVKLADADHTKIDAIAGATISSRAVTEAINIAAKFCRKYMSEVK